MQGSRNWRPKPCRVQGTGDLNLAGSKELETYPLQGLRNWKPKPCRVQGTGDPNLAGFMQLETQTLQGSRNWRYIDFMLPCAYMIVNRRIMCKYTAIEIYLQNSFNFVSVSRLGIRKSMLHSTFEKYYLQTLSQFITRVHC